MKRRRYLLLASCLVVAAAIGWGRLDRRTPDERTYAALQGNFEWLLRSYMVPGRSLLPAQWKLTVETYFWDKIAANQQKLLDSGYLTNCLVLLSNYPPEVISTDDRMTEMQRRLSAAGLGDRFLSYTSTPGTNEEPIRLVCRTLDVPLVLEAIAKPWLTNPPPQAAPRRAP